MSAIQLQVNEKALVQNLRSAFSNTATTWIMELLQNARRAGATEIKISTDDTDNSVYVTDNGCGIADLSKMFTLAESGWDEQVQRTEKPYGLGFLSAPFAAKEVEIRTLDKVMEFSTEYLLDFNNVHVSTMDIHYAETTIILRGVENLPNQAVMAPIVAGFPIPVFFNGVELERPHAVGNMTFAKTSIGLIHLADFDYRSSDLHIYLQGLPIGAKSRFYWSDRTQVVHLDSTQFMGRIPDRDTLVDHEKGMEKIRAVIRELKINYLRRLASVALSDTEEQQNRRLAIYGDAMLHLCPDVLNQFASLPMSCAYLVDVPALDRDQEQTNCKRFTRQDVESEKVLVVEDFYSHSDEDNIAIMSLVAEREMQVLRSWGELDSEHWIQNHVLHSPEKLEIIPVDVVGEDKVFLNYQTIKLVVCQSVKVYCDFYRGSANEKVTIGAEIDDAPVYDTHNQVLYIPKGSTGYNAPCMISSYIDENEQYREDWEEFDHGAISRFVNLIRNKDLAGLFQIGRAHV